MAVVVVGPTWAEKVHGVLKENGDFMCVSDICNVLDHCEPKYVEDAIRCLRRDRLISKEARVENCGSVRCKVNYWKAI